MDMILPFLPYGLVLTGSVAVVSSLGWRFAHSDTQSARRSAKFWRDQSRAANAELASVKVDLDNAEQRNEALATNCARAFVERNEALRKVATLEAFKARRNMSKAQRAKTAPALSKVG